MKTIAIASLCSLLSLLPALGADGWMTDFEAAKKKAAAENKALLIDFTGSDWCGWCIKLREEVFDHEAFGKGVAEHFILVELDFPRDKSKMTEELIAQNDRLVQEYEVQGYPTIYLTDAAGKPFGRTGYQPGGPEAYLAHLAGFREKLVARDQAMAALAGAEGEARAEALEAVLASVPQESISKFYSGQLAELAKLKPQAGIVVSLAEAEARAKQDEQFNTLFQAGDFDGVVALVDKIIKEKKLKGVQCQQLSVYKVNAYVMAEKLEQAVTVLDEVTAMDPESQYGAGAQKYKESLLARIAEKKEAEQKEAEDKATEEKEAAPAKEEASRKRPSAPRSVRVEAMAKEEQAAKQKPSRAVSRAVKLDGSGAGKAAGDAKGHGHKKGQNHPHQALTAKSTEELRKGLEKARAMHQKAVEAVNGSDATLGKLRKEVEAKQKALAKLQAEQQSAQASLQTTKQKLVEMDKAHAAAHRAEEELKKKIAMHEAALERHKQIADLEAQAKALREKAEELRKKAEELRK